MLRRVVQIYGVWIGALALLGLFVENQHLFNLMNVDIALDMVRVLLAAALLYIGFGMDDERAMRGILGVVGVLYIGVAALALIDPTLWGVLPTGLTGFDIALHFATGILAAGVAMLPTTDRTVTPHARS